MSKFVRAAVGLLCLLTPVAGPVDADVVVLKDGSRIETEKAWIEDGAVHFLLPGTETVVIRYAREIVERIEDGRGPPAPQPGRRAAAPSPQQPRSAAPAADPPESEASAQGATSGPPPAPPAREPSPASGPPDVAPVDAVRLEGLQFYNPRRKKHYRTGERAGHETYQQAIEALARQYGRTPAWIESHMGASNDLARIHRNLTAGTPPASADGDVDEHPDVRRHRGVDFYNPRRGRRYWSRRDARHDTFRQAIDALGQHYGRPPEWVENHMGASNDLGRIHRNLLEAGRHSDTPAPAVE